MAYGVYPRPPIAEALIHFRFSEEVSGAQLVTMIQEALGDQYAGQRRQEGRRAPQDSTNSSQTAPPPRDGLNLTFLASEDGLRVVGCGDGSLSVHVLAPYPGWAILLEQATAVVLAAAPLIESGLDHIAVRYIDRIVLPMEESSSFNDYLKTFPSKPDRMPEGLLGFHYVTHSRDPDDGTMASMVLSSASPGEEGRPVAIFDLTVWRPLDTPASVVDSSWHPIVEALHQRQRDIFEDAITDKLRETFQ
ncbi:TIGR04255 family protein [Myxococcota bacterium]|nr:TIGR04255 family protein [Myxococcota bacterium]